MGYHTRNCVTRYGILVLVTSLVACSLNKLVDVDQPDTGGFVDADIVTSYGGAVGMYYDAVFRAADAVSTYTKLTALMTDELQKSSSTGSFGVFDALQLDEQVARSSNGFLELSRARVMAERARGALGRYPLQAPAAYIGELFALEGYARLLLAEGFCSGIPVTTVRYGEDIIYSAGVSREQLLASAIALFDSALVYGKDSAAIVTLARVGKGRARLNLADFTGAAEAVVNVSVTATYGMAYGEGALYWSHVLNESQNFWSVGNAEGGNGLSWIAPARPQQDPRVSLTTTVPIRQAKYPTNGVTTQVVANGIEARLIEAEAQLQPADNPNGPWLTTLNALRATLVNTAGVRLLPDTTDPGTAAGRIKLLFYERAFWMYLTGHRQGDLRRLIRQYGSHGFSVATVYPQGFYPWQSLFGSYGSVVTLAPSPNEEELNHRYTGCFDREP